ncbi:MAG: hypothetical protein E6G94_05030 [Alphaproteobacteria bacterium]|nr:MAG: hypothetical protein E6G94_05030 [Alphaproteobacteria bacterium]
MAHRLRSAILAGEAAPPVAPTSLEECRRKAEAPVGAQDRRTAAQRRSDRHRGLVDHASILLRGKRALVRVANVSKGGITVESSIAPDVGESVSVDVDGTPVAGTVRWARRGRIGIDLG